MDTKRKHSVLTQTPQVQLPLNVCIIFKKGIHCLKTEVCYGYFFDIHLCLLQYLCYTIESLEPLTSLRLSSSF